MAPLTLYADRAGRLPGGQEQRPGGPGDCRGKEPPAELGVVGEQNGAFEHPAEVLFAGVLMLAGAALQALERFVADFQPFQMHDADIFVAAFPNLVLLKFH